MADKRLPMIPIELIDPNPYRDFTIDPIREDRIEWLMESMRSNEPWPNLNARKVGERYQIAFGHHRLEALRRIGETHVALYIREMADEQMLAEMLAENGDDRMTTACLLAAVKAAKTYIDDALRTHEWEVLDKSIQNLFPTEHGFLIARGRGGVGKEPIEKFLTASGSDIKQHRIQWALEAINDQRDGKLTDEITWLDLVSSATTFHKLVVEAEMDTEEQAAVMRTLSRDSPPDVVRGSFKKAVPQDDSQDDDEPSDLQKQLDAAIKDLTVIGQTIPHFIEHADLLEDMDRFEYVLGAVFRTYKEAVDDMPANAHLRIEEMN